MATPQVTGFQFYIDSGTLAGDGNAGNPLRTKSTSSGSTLKFIYTATGAEGADFVVPFPSALATTNYAAHVGGAGLAAFMLFDVPAANYAVGQIRVLSSAPLTAGDKLAVIVAY